MSLRVSQTDRNQVHTSTQYMSLQMISDSSTEVVFVVSYNILCNHITRGQFTRQHAIVEIRVRTCSTGMVNLAMYCAKTKRVGIVFAGMLTLAFSSVHPGGCTGASQVPSPFSAAGIQVRSLCPCRVNWLSKLVMTLPS